MTTDFPTFPVRYDPAVGLGIIVHLDALPVVLLAHVPTLIVHRHMTRGAHAADRHILRQMFLHTQQTPGAILPGPRVLLVRLAQPGKQLQTTAAGPRGILLALHLVRLVHACLQFGHTLAAARFAPPFARPLRAFDLRVLLRTAWIVPVPADA